MFRKCWSATARRATARRAYAFGEQTPGLWHSAWLVFLLLAVGGRSIEDGMRQASAAHASRTPERCIFGLRTWNVRRRSTEGEDRD